MYVFYFFKLHCLVTIRQGTIKQKLSMLKKEFKNEKVFYKMWLLKKNS